MQEGLRSIEQYNAELLTHRSYAADARYRNFQILMLMGYSYGNAWRMTYMDGITPEDVMRGDVGQPGGRTAEVANALNGLTGVIAKTKEEQEAVRKSVEKRYQKYIDFDEDGRVICCSPKIRQVNKVNRSYI